MFSPRPDTSGGETCPSNISFILLFRGGPVLHVVSGSVFHVARDLSRLLPLPASFQTGSYRASCASSRPSRAPSPSRSRREAKSIGEPSGQYRGLRRAWEDDSAAEHPVFLSSCQLKFAEHCSRRLRHDDVVALPEIDP